MKTMNRIKIQWLIPLFMALALFRPSSGLAWEYTNNFSWLELIPPGYWLDSWSFEDGSNWDSDFGFAPLSYSNIVQVPDWDGNALQVDTTNAAWLTYAITENAPGYGEYTNLSLHTGSIEFMFVPNWQSADTNYFGNGPDDWGRFIDIGTWDTNADRDWWSLYLNPSGTGIYFSSGTNGVRTNYLNAPISWDGSTWHQIVLTFGPTNSFLYLDGQLAASGTGVCYLPSGDALTNGFAIGSDFATGLQQAHGIFDDLYTYNYQLSADDVASDYADISPELPGSFHAMDNSPPFPGEGGGGGGSVPGDDFSYSPNYGTNLWIQEFGIISNNFTGILTNTIPGVEYQLLFMNALNVGQWAYQGIPILAYTNWAPWSVPFNPTTNLFLNAMSFQDDTGTGIPNWWWLKYFGQDTNVDSYADPAGDGWTLLQDYQNGWNPTNWNTPSAPEGLAINSFNSSSDTATLSWLPSPGPVTGYTMQTPNGTVNLGNVTSYIDNESSVGATYSVEADYAGGPSAWSDSVSVQQFGLSANIVAGPQGSAYLAISAIPADTYELEVIRIDEVATSEFGDSSYNVTNYITVTDATNGFYSFTNVMVPPDQYVQEQPYAGYGIYFQSADNWYVQALETNGLSNYPVYAGSSYTSAADDYQSSWTVPPYFDGREQLKQNLIFLLRDAGDEQFQYATYSTYNPSIEPYQGLANYSSQPTNYAYAGFYDTESVWSGHAMSNGTNGLDYCRPFYENYLYANFIFTLSDVDPTGANGGDVVALTNSIGEDYTSFLNEGTYNCLLLTNSPPSLFQEPTTQGVTIAPQINDAQWLFSYEFQFLENVYSNGVFYDMLSAGFTYVNNPDGSGTVTMENTPVNYFGIPIQSAEAIYYDEDNNLQVQSESPGSSFTGWPYWAFPQTAQPEFENVEYDVWNANSGALPGSGNFSPTNTGGQPLIAGVGNTTSIAGYSKLAVVNGNPGLYGYLGQYFTNALQIDENGNVTTNSAGVLSSYGAFFPTAPGPAALITMPDPDTGQQGTSIVYCVSLQVDKNHDSVMDTNLFGADATSQGSPMEFWENNGCDAPNTSPSGGLDRDLQVPPNPPNYAPAQFYPLGRITCARDLENFARLWICGMPTLPTNGNYQVTLSWNNVSGTPAINLYNSVETNGGTGYLTDTNIAAEQCTATTISDGMSPYSVSFAGPDVAIANITTNSPYTFPATNFLTGGNQYFLFEGAGIGKGELMMTIYQNTNVVAQSGVWLDLHNVMDFYERAHVTNVFKTFPAMRNNTNASSFVSDYELPNNATGTNQLVVYVHGWRMSDFAYELFSDTMYKRLYWQGYQGRFASIRWPTLSEDDFWFFPRAEAFQTYNPSEYIAFRSAQGVSDYFDWLKSRFPNYSINVAAHSMGNIVMMEALKIQLAEGHKDIDNYVLMQGAVPAECYDSSAPGCPSLIAQESDSPTPDEYLTYPGTISSAINGKMVNFYNTNDFALNFWVANQLLKPDGTLGYTVLPGLETELFPSTVITDPREIMAFAARPRSYTVGAQPNVEGVIFTANQVDLTAQFGFLDQYWDHSGEFNRNIQQTGGFYGALLDNLFP